MQLERKAQIISKLDEEILEEIEDEGEKAHEIETAEEVHSEIAILRIKIERVLQQRSEKEKQKESTRATEMNNPVSKTINMKLPKLEIKRFSGDPKEYKSFKDSFEIAVDRRSDIAEVEKFTYLKSFLTGEASRAVKGLAVTTENYEETLQVLDERYSNVPIIVNSHFEELTKLPAVHNNDDTAKLRELYDKIETNLRSSGAINIQADTYECILLPMLRNKLPKEINLLLIRKFDPKKGLWEIEEIMRELRIELETREHCITEKETKKENVHRPVHNTTKVLVTVEGLKCPYCQASHFPDKCDVVTNIETRKALLKSQRRCFNCTKKGYNFKTCRSKKTCFKCKGKHHTSISYQPRRSEIGENEKKSSENSKVDDKNKKTSTMLTSSIKNREIILQSAVVLLKNPSTQKQIAAKMILDTGSQRSYISQKVRRHLNLKTNRTEEISIDSFGEQSTGLKKYNLVAFNISTKSTTDKAKVRALDVKRLCNRLKGYDINLDPLKYQSYVS